MKKMNKKGFTLIEMLVVIAIIAILVAIVIPVVSSATTKATEAKEVANVRSAIAQYEINALDDPDLEFDPDGKIADSCKKGTLSVTATEVTYTATVLVNSEDDSHVWKWTIGQLLTENTTAKEEG